MMFFETEHAVVRSWKILKMEIRKSAVELLKMAGRR